MKGFFGSVAKGILYFLTPLLWVVGITIGLAISVVLFVIYIFYSLILFFTGRSLFNELEEDVKAREILEAQNNVTQPQLAPQQNQQVFMQNPTINMFSGPQPYNQESIKQEENKMMFEEIPQYEEPVQLSEPEQIQVNEEVKEDSTPNFEEEEFPQEEIKRYVPQGGDVFEGDYKGDLDD